jgi:hypothetical protein
MLADYLIAPSFTLSIINGLLLLFLIIFIIKNYKQVLKLNVYQKISFITILTVAIASHGLMHLGLEKQYNFNPYTWI